MYVTKKYLYRNLSPTINDRHKHMPLKNICVEIYHQRLTTDTWVCTEICRLMIEIYASLFVDKKIVWQKYYCNMALQIQDCNSIFLVNK